MELFSWSLFVVTVDGIIGKEGKNQTLRSRHWTVTHVRTEFAPDFCLEYFPIFLKFYIVLYRHVTP